MVSRAHFSSFARQRLIVIIIKRRRFQLYVGDGQTFGSHKKFLEFFGNLLCCEFFRRIVGTVSMLANFFIACVTVQKTIKSRILITVAGLNGVMFTHG